MVLVPWCAAGATTGPGRPPLQQAYLGRHRGGATHALEAPLMALNQLPWTSFCSFSLPETLCMQHGKQTFANLGLWYFCATSRQSKLSQEQLLELQKSTHFDKKELQQWYKGMLDLKYITRWFRQARSILHLPLEHLALPVQTNIFYSALSWRVVHTNKARQVSSRTAPRVCSASKSSKRFTANSFPLAIRARLPTMSSTSLTATAPAPLTSKSLSAP